jgi:hypothetical protein
MGMLPVASWWAVHADKPLDAPVANVRLVLLVFQALTPGTEETKRLRLLFWPYHARFLYPVMSVVHGIISTRWEGCRDKSSGGSR